MPNKGFYVISPGQMPGYSQVTSCNLRQCSGEVEKSLKQMSHGW